MEFQIDYRLIVRCVEFLSSENGEWSFQTDGSVCDELLSSEHDEWIDHRYDYSDQLADIHLRGENQNL